LLTVNTAVQHYKEILLVFISEQLLSFFSHRTGTFGRVHLVKEKMGKHYFALKVMSIPDVIRLKQEQHVHNEKSVLKEVNHPFLIRLFWTYHDERFLYMLMEYVPGGELFSYLRNMGRFNNSTGLFYSTEIICAIEYLHSKEIVYRDLKPENILLDKEGHIKLTDFGFAKKLVDRTWTLCGTPEYLAPEVIQSKGHGRAVDWWALGILIFEMLSGFPPFFDDNPFGIYQKILAGKIDFPRHLDLYVNGDPVQCAISNMRVCFLFIIFFNHYRWVADKCFFLLFQNSFIESSVTEIIASKF
uniref:Protein kinase domain-containing protein n=1 Tax=Meleagris gallopavo TaxID=9103 RepID=G1NPF4_MELGA